MLDIGRAIAAQGVATLAVANAHFDPANLQAVRSAVEELRGEGDLRVVFPDVTRRRWADLLTDEFRSGACHAGRYEGSMVLATREDLVDEVVQAKLSPHPVSLSEAITAGARSFEELGGDQAYFGDPASATAEEGRQTVARLGAILEQAVVEALKSAD